LKVTSTEVTLAPLDNRALANLCGPLDANLRQIEAALDVSIAHRAGTFTLTATLVDANGADVSTTATVPGIVVIAATTTTQPIDFPATSFLVQLLTAPIQSLLPR